MCKTYFYQLFVCFVRAALHINFLYRNGDPPWVAENPSTLSREKISFLPVRYPSGVFPPTDKRKCRRSSSEGKTSGNHEDFNWFGDNISENNLISECEEDSVMTLRPDKRKGQLSNGTKSISAHFYCRWKMRLICRKDKGETLGNGRAGVPPSSRHLRRGSKLENKLMV